MQKLEILVRERLRDGIEVADGADPLAFYGDQRHGEIQIRCGLGRVKFVAGQVWDLHQVIRQGLSQLVDKGDVDEVPCSKAIHRTEALRNARIQDCERGGQALVAKRLGHLVVSSVHVVGLYCRRLRSASSQRPDLTQCHCHQHERRVDAYFAWPSCSTFVVTKH